MNIKPNKYYKIYYEIYIRSYNHNNYDFLHADNNNVYKIAIKYPNESLYIYIQ